MSCLNLVYVPASPRGFCPSASHLWAPESRQSLSHSSVSSGEPLGVGVPDWERRKEEEWEQEQSCPRSHCCIQSDLVVLMCIIWITAPAPNKLISNSNFKPNYWAWWLMKLLIERKNSLWLWLAEQHHMTGCRRHRLFRLHGCSVFLPSVVTLGGKTRSSARCWHQNWSLISAHLFKFVMLIDWKTQIYHARQLKIHKGCGY